MSLKQWPTDVNTCPIQIGVQNYKVILIDAKLTENGRDSIGLKNSGRNEWKTISMTVVNNQEHQNEDSEIVPFQLEYRIALERNHNLYSQMFGTPLILSLFILLLNFWTAHPYRSILCAVATIILAIMFLIMADSAPLSYVPVISKKDHLILILFYSQ